MPLYQGTRNSIPVEKPYPDIEAVKEWTLYGSEKDDKLLIEGYPDDSRVPMPSWRYDWKLQSWMKTA